MSTMATITATLDTDYEGTPYVDSWGNRFATADAAHSAPGPLTLSPRRLTQFDKAVMGTYQGHRFVFPTARYTRAHRIGMVAFMMQTLGHPVPQGVQDLPLTEREAIFERQSYMSTGRYERVQLIEKTFEGARVMGYSTTTSGGGDWPVEVWHFPHTASLDAAKAALVG